MKILMINSVCGFGSTGRICTDLAESITARGDKCAITYGRGTAPEKLSACTYKIGNDFDVKIHGLMTRLFDNHGFCSKKSTEKLIAFIKEYNPDVIHLHNLHGYYLNVKVLFEYLKTCKKKIVWTLHDCWAFTGHCAYYSAADCSQWKSACKNCACIADYPKSYAKNNVYKNYSKKKELFCGVENLTLVTPSKWLANQVEMSFLKEYKTVVIPNGIDTAAFSPASTDAFYELHKSNKKVLLGVASVWSKNKGLDSFNRLADIIGDSYKIVLVGIDDSVSDNVNKKILCLPRTQSVEKLSDIYSSADLFINPSIEETMGMTTVEALACGTPAVVYNRTAVPEVINSKCGIAVEPKADNIANVLENALKINKSACVKRAGEFSLENQINNYLRVYGDFQ